MSTKLLRNPTNIGDIFFSGSQTVIKGQQVTWILDDTWAFKATEDCGVSTNASPFVQLRAGQTFLIYKRTQADIDAGNNKGIYIFDRDTIVALAYPQEVTQDLIIENDIYNDTINNININVEAQKRPPAAGISISNTKPTVGTAVTIKSTSFAYSPATISSYVWLINGAPVGGGAASFTYTVDSAAREYTVELEITDTEGLKGKTKAKIYSQAVVVIPPVEISLSDSSSSHNVGDGLDTYLNQKAGKTATGLVTFKASMSVESNSSRHGALIQMTINRNGTRIGVVNKTLNFGHSMVIEYNGNIGNKTISSSDVFTVSLERVGDTGNYNASNAQLNIKIQP